MAESAISSQTAKDIAAKNPLASKVRPTATGKRILYTGPSGVGNYRANLAESTFYIGTKTLPKEGTSEALYLWRPAPMNRPPWLRKNSIVGEIGWGVEEYGPLLRRGFPRKIEMKKEVFPPAEEYEMIYRYMNPMWNMRPPPNPQVLGWAGYPGNDPARPSRDSMYAWSNKSKNPRL